MANCLKSIAENIAWNVFVLLLFTLIFKIYFNIFDVIYLIPFASSTAVCLGNIIKKSIKSEIISFTSLSRIWVMSTVLGFAFIFLLVPFMLSYFSSIHKEIMDSISLVISGLTFAILDILRDKGFMVDKITMVGNNLNITAEKLIDPNLKMDNPSENQGGPSGQSQGGPSGQSQGGPTSQSGSSSSSGEEREPGFLRRVARILGRPQHNTRLRESLSTRFGHRPVESSERHYISPAHSGRVTPAGTPHNHTFGSNDNRIMFDHHVTEDFAGEMPKTNPRTADGREGTKWAKGFMFDSFNGRELEIYYFRDTFYNQRHQCYQAGTKRDPVKYFPGVNQTGSSLPGLYVTKDKVHMLEKNGPITKIAWSVPHNHPYVNNVD